MKREPFVASRQASWERFASILERLERPPRRRRRAGDGQAEEGDAGDRSPDVGEFPRLYRLVCQDLALARHRRYGRALEGRLNALALRGHHQLYRRPTRLGRKLVGFLAHGFPAAVRANARWVGTATVLFLGPFLAMMVCAWLHPAGLRFVLDPETAREFEAMYDPESREVAGGRSSAEDVSMFAFYIANNGGIALRTFAGSLLLGIGTLFFLVYNGLILGAVFGRLTVAGMGVTLYPFVIGHGAFELTAIVLSGAAGLKLGHALISPGRRSRRRAMLEAARECLPIVLGAFAMIVVAAFVEGFWSPSGSSPATKYTVGAALWMLVLAYFVLAGRRHAAG